MDRLINDIEAAAWSEHLRDHAGRLVDASELTEDEMARGRQRNRMLVLALLSIALLLSDSQGVELVAADKLQPAEHSRAIALESYIGFYEGPNALMTDGLISNNIDGAILTPRGAEDLRHYPGLSTL